MNESENENDDGGDDDEQAENGEEIDTAFAVAAENTRRVSANEFSQMGVTDSTTLPKQTDIAGLLNGGRMKGANISDRSQFAAKSSSSNGIQLGEPLEYEIPLDDGEEAGLSEVEDDEEELESELQLKLENNNESGGGKSGSNDGLTKGGTVSVVTDSSSPRNVVGRPNGGAGKRVKEEESDEEHAEDDDEEDNEGDNAADTATDDDDDDQGDDQDEDGDALKEADLDTESEQEEGGRSRQLGPVLGHQNLSGFRVAGSASARTRESKLDKANNKVEQELEARSRGQVGLERHRNQSVKLRGATSSLGVKKKEKNQEDRDEQRTRLEDLGHKAKDEGISRFASYLGDEQEETVGKEEYNDTDLIDRNETLESGARVSDRQSSILDTNNRSQNKSTATPLLEPQYNGRVRENERLVDLVPKLRILNQVEVCDIELFILSSPSSLENDNDDNRDHPHRHLNSQIEYLKKKGKNIITGDHSSVSKAKLSSSASPSASMSSANNVEDKQDKKGQDKQDFERRKLPFIVGWIDRINGEATLEAKSELLMNCEKQQKYTFKMRAIGCNGLHSNE